MDGEQWQAAAVAAAEWETSWQIVTNDDAALHYYVYVRLPMPEVQTKESIITIIVGE